MSQLKDYKIPNNMNYVKLKDFPDGEEITIISAGINRETKFGDQAFFVSEEGERISLPSRYVDYIETILIDEDAFNELSKGVKIVKSSRDTINGGTTPIFTFV